MTPEQKQLEQVKGRLAAHKQEIAKYRNHEWAKGDALHYYEAPDDVDFLLSLVKSQEAGCSLCGSPHDFDTSVPSAVWNAVIRARELPDYLCVTCIVREFVRAGQSFTATLWNEEFNGVPIEVIINGQNAKDATAIQEENNSLRAELSSSAEAIVNEAGKVSRLISNASTSMRSACVEKVKETRDSVESACNAALIDVYDLSIANAPMPVKDCRQIADCIGDRVGQIRQAIAALTEELESLSIEKPKE